MVTDMKKALSILTFVALVAAVPLLAQVARSTSSSTALEKARLAKTQPTTLFDARVYNNSSVTMFAMLFDTNAAPADGSVPLQIEQVTTNQTAKFTYPTGRPMSYGIYVCASSTTNLLTLVSSNCVLIDVIFDK